MAHILIRLRWFFVILLFGLTLLLGIACGSDEKEMVIQLMEQEGSGQSGAATLTQKDGQTEVVLKVNPGPPANDPQPLHIHFGTCGANLGNVDHSLNDVVSGQSTTLLNISLDSVRDGNHAINLHLSLPGIRTYTSCGNIPKS